jgi:heme-degrading monooxygenase HmoA
MVLEVAILNVREGQEEPFEIAMTKARPLIEASSGFAGIEVHRCIERPNRYLLLVSWRSQDDHIIGFKGSDRYQQWRELLHHFYDPFPVVEHYSGDLFAAQS